MTKLRVLTSLLASLSLLGLGGCGDGGGDRPPPTYTTQIVSDPAYDGDIEQTSANSYVVTQGMTPQIQTIFAGIDPVSGDEFRAFLDFPLSGPGGVPGNAGIESAFLEFYLDNLEPSSTTLPVLVELVSFQPPNILPTDFDRSIQPPLASVRISPPITQSDIGTFVSIDVTPLMIQAQRLGLSDFQVRIMEDLGPPIAGLMTIDETIGANRSKSAPLLTVTYF